jgi:hypothetical protein
MNENIRVWREAGYELINDRNNKCAPHFNRLLGFIEREHGVKHPEWRDQRHKVPDTEMGSEMRWVDGRRVDTPCLMPGYWMASWIIKLVEYERQWRRECDKGTATAEEHGDIVQALHEGLSGNLDQVEAFFGLKELATDYKYEHGLYVAPAPFVPAIGFAHDENTGFYRSGAGQVSICVNGTTGMFMTLDEVRAANGLPPLEE